MKRNSQKGRIKRLKYLGYASEEISNMEEDNGDKEYIENVEDDLEDEE